jgi:CHAD domain-containing protein
MRFPSRMVEAFGSAARVPRDMVELAGDALAGDAPASQRTPGVRSDDPWPDAGRKVLRFHLERMVSRAPGVIAGEDPEEVHAMRVASRRTRTAWRVFGDGFKRGTARPSRRDLREVGDRLGAVRDVDVLLGILDAYLTRRGPRARTALLPLGNAWNAERQASHGALVEFVSSPRFAGVVAECGAFLDEGRPGETVERPFPGSVRTRLPATAWAAYGNVWAFDERLGGVSGTDLVTLHQLRIAARHLRYTLEFARETLGDDAGALIDPIIALQDHLGDQHDLHVAATRTREFAAAATTSKREAAELDRFVRDLDRRVDRYGRRFGRVWQPIVMPSYRARLGRALNRR